MELKWIDVRVIMQTAEELVREILIVRRTTDEEGLTFQNELNMKEI